MSQALPNNIRLLLFHKQAISSRLNFLCLAHGMCAFEPLPVTAKLAKENEISAVTHHPTCYLPYAETYFKLAAGSLRSEPEFNAVVYTAPITITIYLVRFTTLDPPFAAVKAVGGRFITLTEARSYPPVELELLRRVYTTVLG
ncbi:MAG: hypothetical protein HC877_12480 [Thioploca sp.]|nr:hypothetical protein [Thioploca sp.]